MFSQRKSNSFPVCPPNLSNSLNPPLATTTMASVKQLNSKAEVLGRNAALFMNINAAKGLLEVMKTNLGPKGTIKMLVGGAGGAMRARCRLQALIVGLCHPLPALDARSPFLRPRRPAPDQGRQCAAAGDANPKPDRRDDRPHGRRTGRHHRVRCRPLFGWAAARRGIGGASELGAFCPPTMQPGQQPLRRHPCRVGTGTAPRPWSFSSAT